MILAKLYRLTDEGYYRIQPELGRDETCGLIQRYLLECIRQNLTDTDGIKDRWEAAQILHVWFLHLSEMNDAAGVLKNVAQAITEFFLASSGEVRNAIEAGFLEHTLETAELRPCFEHWANDERLREPWERALEWGKAHPNNMANMLKKLSGAKR